MATVRISHAIRAHVYGRIYALFAERLEKNEKKLHDLNIGRTVYDSKLDPDLRAKAETLVQAGWVTPETSLRVAIEHGEIKHRGEFILSPPALIPNKHGRYTNNPLDLTPDIDPPFPAAAAILEEGRRLTSERDLLINNIVNGVLVQCTTLKQVLELWPGALEFMPEDVRARHNMTQEKREKAVIDNISDETKLALMKARLSCTQ